MTVQELAREIGAELRGDGTRVVTGCAGLEEATADHVSFLANRRYAQHVRLSKAGAVVVSPADAQLTDDHTLLIAADPYFAFRQAVVALHGYRKHPAAGVSELAVVDPTAKLGKDVCIQPFVHIGPNVTVGDRTVIYPHCYVGPDAVVGEDCLLFPNVTIYDRCTLGNRVTLHAGCVIGQDGFGYATHKGAHHKIPQIGNVIVEDDVEMGANCAVDRATVGSTIIGKGTKFSDLVAIGHGACIGEHNLLVAQVGIAGSVETGKYVVMGGQAGVAGHLKIGDMVQLAAKAGVMTDVPSKSQYGGQPAMPMYQTKRSLLALAKLPDLATEFRKLQKRVAELEAKNKSSQ